MIWSRAVSAERTSRIATDTSDLGSDVRPSVRKTLLHRQIDYYPTGWERRGRLALAVTATVILYYQQYVFGAVSSLTSADFGMSFLFLTGGLAVANCVGAFGSLAAGLADRLGRTNVVIYGLIALSVLTAVAMPLSSDKWSFVWWSSVIGLVEGMLLVATPALVRDFSPQTGRAKAMGLWAVAPAAGSLLATGIAASTLSVFGDSWRSQFVIAGTVGLILVVVAIPFMKELSPALRDQTVESEGDTALAEARAASGETTVSHSWKPLLTPGIILPAVGFSLMLLFYYTVVTVAPLMFGTGFGLSATQSNAVVSTAWAFNVVVALFFGVVVDRYLVRKPWILLGALMCIAAQIVLLFMVGSDATVTAIGVVMVCLAMSWSIFQIPWFAAYTETIEAKSPSLVAGGMAIWAWVLRIVITLSFLIIPQVVSSATTLIQGEPAIAEFTAAQRAGEPADAALTDQMKDIAVAADQVVGQWQLWMWIAVACAVVFIATIPALTGRWSTKAARVDQLATRARQTEELTRLQAQLEPTTVTSHTKEVPL